MWVVSDPVFRYFYAFCRKPLNKKKEEIWSVFKLHGNSVYVPAWSAFACWEAGTRNYHHLRGRREASLSHDSLSIIYYTQKKRRTQWIHMSVCAKSHGSRFLTFIVNKHARSLLKTHSGITNAVVGGSEGLPIPVSDIDEHAKHQTYRIVLLHCSAHTGPSWAQMCGHIYLHPYCLDAIFVEGWRRLFLSLYC